jgi:hypothetical protein
MKPSLIKRSTLTETKLPFKPSILTKPDLKIKEQIQKALTTYKK